MAVSTAQDFTVKYTYFEIAVEIKEKCGSASEKPGAPQ